MKVTLINRSDAGGGAPAACMRLLKALESQQVDDRLLAQEKLTSEPRVTSIVNNKWQRFKAKFDFLSERLPFIWFYAKEKAVRFAFSTATTGTDISEHPDVADADILHLHWTNFGYLSTENIEQLFKTGKPIVWTLHDMWAFTGGCHYSGECNHFTNQCGDCWMLRNPNEKDLSREGWLRKLEMYKAANKIVLVTCSNWLADEAKSSSLLSGFPIQAIPNPIDTDLFSAKDKTSLRQKWNVTVNAKIILFGAANIMDRRKGISYLVDALHDLKKNYKETEDIEIVIFGKNKAFDTTSLPFKAHEVGIIRSQAEMAELYALADVYVSPAIEDNLPNTVMESLSCATPVVAFHTGGIPDMVEHRQNGYLAQFKSAADLAAGLNCVLNEADGKVLAENARNKVLNTFTNEIVSKQYMAVYRSLLNKK